MKIYLMKNKSLSEACLPQWPTVIDIYVWYFNILALVEVFAQSTIFCKPRKKNEVILFSWREETEQAWFHLS